MGTRQEVEVNVTIRMELFNAWTVTSTQQILNDINLLIEESIEDENSAASNYVRLSQPKIKQIYDIGLKDIKRKLK